MTNEQILTKAIEKAQNNGWDDPPLKVWVNEVGTDVAARFIIFSYSFAQAFWGEEKEGWIGYDWKVPQQVKHWEYHLSKMVLEEEPLQYLKKFI